MTQTSDTLLRLQDVSKRFGKCFGGNGGIAVVIVHLPGYFKVVFLLLFGEDRFVFRNFGHVVDDAHPLQAWRETDIRR